MAQSTVAWLITIRENLIEVEQDTEEVFGARRELTKLHIERIPIERDGDDKAEVEITCRFGPPDATLEEIPRAYGVQSSEEFSSVHGRSSGEGQLRGNPKMSSYEVAVERDAERNNGAD